MIFINIGTSGIPSSNLLAKSEYDSPNEACCCSLVIFASGYSDNTCKKYREQDGKALSIRIMYEKLRKKSNKLL